MRALIQRVTSASVHIEGNEFSKIDNGLLVLLGVEGEDSESDIDWLSSKISQMKDAAIKDIKDTSINIAIEAVKKTISTSVDKSKLDILFEKNLEETKIELKKVNS